MAESIVPKAIFYTKGGLGTMNTKNNGGLKPPIALGVLGGMGPAASAEFLRILAEKAPAKTDQEHPLVYMISDPRIPDRSSAILGRGDDPTDQLRQDLESLAAMGVGVLAVPCNTAHYFIDKFREELPVPLVHIVEATVLAAKQLNQEGCWMLSTIGTQQSGLYQAYADKISYPLSFPNAEATAKTQESICLVKSGDMKAAGTLMREVVLSLWAEKELPIMAACTEIPLAYQASGLPLEKMVSSLDALAAACLNILYPSDNAMDRK